MVSPLSRPRPAAAPQASRSPVSPLLQTLCPPATISSALTRPEWSSTMCAAPYIYMTREDVLDHVPWPDCRIKRIDGGAWHAERHGHACALQDVGHRVNRSHRRHRSPALCLS